MYRIRYLAKFKHPKGQEFDVFVQQGRGRDLMLPDEYFKGTRWDSSAKLWKTRAAVERWLEKHSWLRERVMVELVQPAPKEPHLKVVK